MVCGDFNFDNFRKTRKHHDRDEHTDPRISAVFSKYIDPVVASHPDTQALDNKGDGTALEWKHPKMPDRKIDIEEEGTRRLDYQLFYKVVTKDRWNIVTRHIPVVDDQSVLTDHLAVVTELQPKHKGEDQIIQFHPYNEGCEVKK